MNYSEYKKVYKMNYEEYFCYLCQKYPKADEHDDEKKPGHGLTMHHVIMPSKGYLGCVCLLMCDHIFLVEHENCWDDSLFAKHWEGDYSSSFKVYCNLLEYLFLMILVLEDPFLKKR